MAEAEKESRREQQRFSMDALKMLGNTLKDVANGKERSADLNLLYKNILFVTPLQKQHYLITTLYLF